MCSTHPPTISVKCILKEVVALTIKLQCPQNINGTKWKIQLELNSLSSSKFSLFYGFKCYCFIEHKVSVLPPQILLTQKEFLKLQRINFEFIHFAVLLPSHFYEEHIKGQKMYFYIFKNDNRISGKLINCFRSF